LGTITQFIINLGLLATLICAIYARKKTAAYQGNWEVHDVFSKDKKNILFDSHYSVQAKYISWLQPMLSTIILTKGWRL
jgi:hypothetical protein